MNASLPDLRGEHRTELIPPEPHSLMADIHTPLEQQVFDLPQLQRIADVNHHREADHLGRTVEISKGIMHRRTLRIVSARLKPI